MRIAVMVLGLLISAWGFLEVALGGMFVPEDSKLGTGIALGLFAVLIGAFGSAIAIPAPRATAVLLLIAGAFSMGAGANEYKNQYVWGAIYFILAIMAFFGWRGKKRDTAAATEEKRLQRERDVRMENLLTQQRQPVPVMGMVCQKCGSANPSGTRFCGNCGNQVAA